jgi:hypothetical protein
VYKNLAILNCFENLLVSTLVFLKEQKALSASHSLVILTQDGRVQHHDCIRHGKANSLAAK